MFSPVEDDDVCRGTGLRDEDDEVRRGTSLALPRGTSLMSPLDAERRSPGGEEVGLGLFFGTGGSNSRRRS